MAVEKTGGIWELSFKVNVVQEFYCFGISIKESCGLMAFPSGGKQHHCILFFQIAWRFKKLFYFFIHYANNFAQNICTRLHNC